MRDNFPPDQERKELSEESITSEVSDSDGMGSGFPPLEWTNSDVTGGCGLSCTAVHSCECACTFLALRVGLDLLTCGSLDSGVGAGIDSYYEYLMKAYILLGDDVFLQRFNTVSRSPPSLVRPSVCLSAAAA